MINQKTLLSLGFKLKSEYRRYNTYSKDEITIDVAKYKTQGEYHSTVTLNGEQHVVKTLEELKKLI
jgi:hypothetical protein